MEIASWLIPLGGLVLSAAQFGYKIWCDRRNKENDLDDGEPPVAAAA